MTMPPNDPFAVPDSGATGPDRVNLDKPGTAAQPPYGQPQGWDQAPGQPGYGPSPGYGPPPGQPGYGQPPGYGAAPGYGGPGYPAAAPTSTKAIVALVSAIGSFVVLPFVLAIVGLILASMAKREIDASGGQQSGLGLVTAAKIVSWINLGLCVLFVVLIVGALALFGSSNGEFSTY